MTAAPNSTGRSIRRSAFRAAALIPLAIALGGFAAHADNIILVPATTDIWLAGQLSGSSVTGFFGTDYAPANSPASIAVGGGDLITFAATEITDVSVDGTCSDTTPDAGACYADEFGDSSGPANGISLAHVPAGALVGVFVAAGGPSGTAPAALDFSAGGLGTGFATLSPALDQLFFIGDGLTGTGTGSVQQFFAPAGATELYLAVSDSVGGSGNNSGEIQADVTESPEPGTFLLAGGCLLALLALRRRSLA